MGNEGTNSNICVANIIEFFEKDEINNLIEKFWKMLTKIPNGVDEEFCDNYFLDSLERDGSGRLIVRSWEILSILLIINSYLWNGNFQELWN